MLLKPLRLVAFIALLAFATGCSRNKEATIDPSAMPELTQEMIAQTHATLDGRWALDHEATLSRLSSAKRGIASAYLGGLTAGIVFSPDGTWVQTVARNSGVTLTQGTYTIEASDGDAILVRLIPEGEETGPRRDIFVEGKDVLRFSIDGHSANSEGDPFRRVSEEAFDAQMRTITER